MSKGLNISSLFFPFLSNLTLIQIEMKRFMILFSPALQFEYQMNVDGQIEDH